MSSFTLLSMLVSRRPPRRILQWAALSLALLTASPALGESRQLSLRQQDSWILAITGKGGLFRFLGHRHAVLAPSLDSRICYDPESAADSWAHLSFSTSSLVIDSEEALRRAGIERTVDSEERGRLQEKMQSSRFLAAEEHPAIIYRTTSVEEKSPSRWLLTGELTVRGVSSEVEVAIRIERLQETLLQFRGELTITHRQFGMKPESIAGVVRVAEEIDLELHLVGELSGRACASRSERATQE